ncbi:Haemagglutinin [Oligella ureolytica]|uniref:Haemagglutinin n=1 Tax=Oligella ureolytica TaxID=90244 RepID=A0A378XFF6_9BURK|nr:YadA-like family protein [Oligella ureolytica]QPT39038.1 YadA-like family protein [Oligella ureolytica]SUA54583.1 Haemagglutinin [Oligella ureolytica]
MSVAKTDAVAVGYAAKAETTAVALGVGAQAKEGNIALGNNSFASNVSGAGSITGQAFSGTSVSVGNAETGLTRRITNVQDGHSGYDAVNVRQLEALKASLGSFEPESGGNVNYNPEGNTISVGDATAGNHAVSLQQAEALIADGKPRFYSVNPNGDSANANGEGALGPNSDNSMAIGHAARIDSAEKATAVGYKVLVKSNDGTALGSGSIVDDAAGVAVGLGAYSRGINSLAIGTDAQTEEKANGANADNAIAIGTKARASENSASALGHHATASGLKSSAMGFHANATGPDAIAFGSNSVASGSSSQASGTGARASGANAQASGTGARASGANAQASGTGARASGASAQASGTSAFGYASDGIALGTGAVSGFFDLHNQNPERNTAGIAIGSRSLADQQHALAMGVEAEARAKSSSAIGDGAKAQHEGSVALGSSAKTAAAVGFETYTIDKQTYTFAGTEPIATVSVGNDEEKRTITNVAAGHISAQSTDAINGSQLFQTNKAVDALGNNLDTAGESVAKALGGTSSYSPETHTVTAGLTVQGNKYTTVQDALNYVGQGWKVSAQGNNPTNVLPGETVDFKTGNSNLSVTKPADADEITYTLSNALDLTSSGSVTIGDTVLNNNGLTINGGPSVTTAGIDAGDLKITNVAPGDINPISKDAVNGSQLNSLADEIVNSYGGNASQTGGDITFTDIGGTGEDTIHDAIKQVNATANAGWNVSSNNGTTSANIGPDGTVDFTGDSNITIEQTGTDDDAKLAVKLNRDLDLDSVTAGGTVINANGLSFINLISGEPLPNTVAIKPYGIDMGNNKISNLAAGTNSTDAVNVGQLKGVVEVFGGEATIGLDGTLIAPTYVVGNADQEFNTVGDAIKELNTGWTVKSDGTIGGNTDGSAIQARDIVDIGVKNPADENLLVESKQDGDTTTIDFSLNQNLKLTSVNAGGTLINSDGLSFVDASGVQLPNTVFIKPDGIDMGGNKITNVAPGTIGEDSTDAINGSQLWALGDSLAKVFGGNAAFDPETGGLTITPYEINGEEFEDVYSAINKLAEGWKIDVGSGTPGESGGEGSAPGAGTGTGGPESILPGDQLTLVAGDNIIIEQKPKEDKNVNIEISVNPNLVVDSVTAGQTVMDDSGVKVGDNVHLGDTGLTIVGGPTGDLAFTADKVDVGGNKIQNVADGIIADGSKDAINGGQIKEISQSVADAFGGGSTVNSDGTVSAPTYTVGNQDKVVNNVGDALDILNQGWTLSAEGNDTQVQAGDKVSLVNDDKNIVITHAADSGTVAFNLSDNIQVGETITIGGDKNNQTVINQGGITTNTVTATSVTTNNFNAGGGTMIVNEGSVAIAENTHINMGGNRITNVAPGVDGTDVVNMNQLGTVANSLSRDIRRVDREARAGTASAAAMANLPQAYLPGKSMFAVAGAGHRGESGYAAGLSTVSDNGKWVIKGSVAGNSRGDVTYGAGVGYQW